MDKLRIRVSKSSDRLVRNCLQHVRDGVTAERGYGFGAWSTTYRMRSAVVLRLSFWSSRLR